MSKTLLKSTPRGPVHTSRNRAIEIRQINEALSEKIEAPIETDDIADGAITLDKIQDIPGDSVLGKPFSSPGPPVAITIPPASVVARGLSGPVIGLQSVEGTVLRRLPGGALQFGDDVHLANIYFDGGTNHIQQIGTDPGGGLNFQIIDFGHPNLTGAQAIIRLFQGSATTGRTQLQIKDNTGVDQMAHLDTGGANYVCAAGASGQNFGIGTDTPQEKLDVAGNVGFGDSGEGRISVAANSPRLESAATDAGGTRFIYVDFTEIVSDDAQLRFFRNTNTTGNVRFAFFDGQGVNSAWFVGGRDEGLRIGSPTGSSQGSGTLNAEGLFENGNPVLTDYVFDQAVDGKFDKSKYPQAPAQEFDSDDLDLSTFSDSWKSTRKLPAIRRAENRCEEGKRPSLGEFLQALVETVEVQAVHIEKLSARIEALETTQE